MISSWRWWVRKCCHMLRWLHAKVNIISAVDVTSLASRGRRRVAPSFCDLSFFLPSKCDYIENPCLLMYLNACFMTPDHTTSTATDAFNLESGVDQLLLRQRGEELQRICDEILAQRPSAINGQPSHKSQKGHRGQRNGSAQKESGWLLACLLLARCRTCGWLGGLIHRTPRSGQIFGQNRSNPRCSYCLSCRFGSGVSHSRVVLRFVVGLTLPYYVSRLVLWRA